MSFIFVVRATQLIVRYTFDDNRQGWFRVNYSSVADLPIDGETVVIYRSSGRACDVKYKDNMASALQKNIPATRFLPKLLWDLSFYIRKERGACGCLISACFTLVKLELRATVLLMMLMMMTDRTIPRCTAASRWASKLVVHRPVPATSSSCSPRGTSICAVRTLLYRGVTN